MKLIFAVSAFFLLTLQGDADVLIYKGISRNVSDANSALPKNYTVYQVIDPDTGSVGSLFTFSVGNQRAQFGSPVTEYRLNQIPLHSGKTATIISVAVASGTTNDGFTHVLNYSRGTDTSLKLNSKIVGNIMSFPRTFIGAATRSAAAFGQSIFLDLRMTLNYQQTRTITANDADLTIEQVMNALSAELLAKGFVQL